MPVETLPLACFGKIPCWREHLEQSVSYPSSRSFRDWLRRGRADAGLESPNDGKAEFLETRRQRFLLAPAGSVELAAGVIRPSRDQANRPYPFVVLAHFPRKPYGRHYALLPLALEPVWEALDDAWDMLHGAASRPAFDELLETTAIPAPAPPGAIRGVYQGSQQEPLGRLFDRTDGATLERLAGNLPRAVGLLRKQNGRGVRLALPISSDLKEASFDAAFWIDLINHQFLWRRFEPSVFLDEGADLRDRRALLVFGELAPGDYAALMGDGADPPTTSRPAHEEAAQAASATPADAGGLTFAELLGRRFRG